MSNFNFNPIGVRISETPTETPIRFVEARIQNRFTRHVLPWDIPRVDRDRIQERVNSLCANSERYQTIYSAYDGVSIDRLMQQHVEMSIDEVLNRNQRSEPVRRSVTDPFRDFTESETLATLSRTNARESSTATQANATITNTVSGNALDAMVSINDSFPNLQFTDSSTFSTRPNSSTFHTHIFPDVEIRDTKLYPKSGASTSNASSLKKFLKENLEIQIQFVKNENTLEVKASLRFAGETEEICSDTDFVNLED